MNKITEILDSLDFTKLVPDLNTLLGRIQLACDLLILMGPIILLALGLFYLFLSPKEANHKMGFRTYFGMGSVEAWQFMQRIAGITFSGLGGLLTVIMVILCLTMGGKELDQIVQTAMTSLIWQVALVLIAYLALFILAAVRYDRFGKRRDWSKDPT